MKSISLKLVVWSNRWRAVGLRFLSVTAAALLLLIPLVEARRAQEGADSADGSQGLASYSVQVEMVGLQATVQDRSGKVIPGLGKDDFTIYDNGQPQVITQFSREDMPLSVSIVLDTSSSMAGRKIADARRSLDHFLARLNPADEVMLMTFRTRPEIVRDFTQRFANVGTALNYLEGRGYTALYDAVVAALDGLRAAQHRRRVVLLISDGLNTCGRAQLQDAVEQLKRQSVELFAISLDTSPSYSMDKLVSRFALGKLSGSAGGGVFMVNNPERLSAVCSDIAERMHKQYTFAYYPPRAANGDWRTIRIRSKIPGLRVLASKSGYYPSLEQGFSPLP